MSGWRGSCSEEALRTAELNLPLPRDSLPESGRSRPGAGPGPRATQPHLARGQATWEEQTHPPWHVENTDPDLNCHLGRALDVSPGEGGESRRLKGAPRKRAVSRLGEVSWRPRHRWDHFSLTDEREGDAPEGKRHAVPDVPGAVWLRIPSGCVQLGKLCQLWGAHVWGSGMGLCSWGTMGTGCRYQTGHRTVPRRSL